MSLDISLVSNEPTEESCRCSCGHEHVAISHEEHYSANITHNLSKMAKALGIRDWLWYPPEGTTAEQLIDPLQKAINLMRANPEEYRQYDSPNGWGTYDDFLPWLQHLLDECQVYPKALVRSWA